MSRLTGHRRAYDLAPAHNNGGGSSHLNISSNIYTAMIYIQP